MLRQCGRARGQVWFGLPPELDGRRLRWGYPKTPFRDATTGCSTAMEPNIVTAPHSATLGAVMRLMRRKCRS